jgi:hypothetical protein
VDVIKAVCRTRVVSHCECMYVCMNYTLAKEKKMGYMLLVDFS